MRRRKRIAWVWSISYICASVCIAGGVWAYLSLFYSQAHSSESNRFWLELRPEAFNGSRLFSVPPSVVARDILSMGGRALVFVLVLAVPGFELNQQIWAALRARPRRILGARIYGWKLLALNIAILLSGPIVASLQFYLDHS